ncbi:MAG TPA: ABC transporter permease [Candidatus Krumholzibacteria bacterium]|nr:ABC transporter permease [Candidatus Krumholzibacteria bacterium]
MIGYLLRSLRRQLQGSRTLFALTVAGVALGVASVVAIQTLNRGALEAFDGSMRAVSGQADLTVTGTIPTLDETKLVTVLADPDVRAAWPLVRLDAAVAGREGLYLDIVGFDVFAPVRYPLGSGPADTTGADPGRLLRAALTTPGWVALTPEFAAEQGWSVGDTLTVSSGSRLAHLVVGALVDFKAYEPLAPRRLAVMDIAWAQALLGRPGRVHQVDVVLREGADPVAVAARLGAALGPGLRVQTPEQRQEDASGLLAAFRLNLTALSLISVFVGLFLVLTAVQAALVRRRTEFGVLRSLGATPRQVLGLIVAEAALVGLVGVALGVPLGWLAALRNLDSVSGTLTSIYVMEGIEHLTLPLRVVLLAVGVGVAGAVIGAVGPALDMARRDTGLLLAPLNLHRATGRVAGRLAAGSVLVALAATAWFLPWGRHLRAGGFLYGFIMMVCLPLVVPLVVRTVTRPLRPRGIGAALALRNLAARLQTTSLAVAALAVTASMLVGITLLIGSFRATLVTWLDTTIRADVYVSTPSWVRAGNDAFLDRPLLDTLGARTDVRAVEEQRRLRVRTADGQHLVWLSGIRIDGPAGEVLADRLPLAGGDAATVAAGLDRGGVLIGEPLARKGGYAAGDTLVLAGPEGPVALPVVGVAYDYTSEGGTAFVLMDRLVAAFGPTAPNNAALFLEPGIDAEAVVADLQQRYAGRPLVFRSNATLRAEVMAIFDQTFAVTRTLQAMAMLIAVAGVSLTLLIQARERAGELAMLRALGATRRQVFTLFVGEGAAMGALGLMMGMGGGIGLAALLILVINRAWFGWTIQPHWPGAALAGQAALVMLASAAAAVYPALRAGLSDAGRLTRDDL